VTVTVTGGRGPARSREAEEFNVGPWGCQAGGGRLPHYLGDPPRPVAPVTRQIKGQ